MRVPPVPKISAVPDTEKLLRDWERYLSGLQELVDSSQATIDALQTTVSGLQTTVTGLQTDVDSINASRVTAMLGTDNAAIAAGSTPVTVSNLGQTVKIGEAWFVEWILDVVQSVANDVLVFNVYPDAGAFTGRYTVTALNGVAGTWDGGVDLIEAPIGTQTTASDFAPGGKTAGGLTTVSVRARGVHSVADGLLRVGLVATDAAGAPSGTATVKAHSLMLSRKAV